MGTQLSCFEDTPRTPRPKNRPSLAGRCDSSTAAPSLSSSEAPAPVLGFLQVAKVNYDAPQCDASSPLAPSSTSSFFTVPHYDRTTVLAGRRGHDF